MAQIPSTTKFIGLASSVNTTERRSATINAESEAYTMQDVTDTVRPYKVFTALLTQIGGDDPQDFSSGNVPLTIGKTYTIAGNDSNTADFTNIGAPNNEVGTSFIATGSYPNNWGINDNAGLASNGGAPVATVLENTIGNISFEYNGEGFYSVVSAGLFIEGKTFSFIGSSPDTNSHAYIASSGGGSNIARSIQTSINGVYSNDVLNGTALEIRIYN